MNQTAKARAVLHRIKHAADAGLQDLNGEFPVYQGWEPPDARRHAPPV
jgi:hypothetical protein